MVVCKDAVGSTFGLFEAVEKVTRGTAPLIIRQHPLDGFGKQSKSRGGWEGMAHWESSLFFSPSGSSLCESCLHSV